MKSFSNDENVMHINNKEGIASLKKKLLILDPKIAVISTITELLNYLYAFTEDGSCQRKHFVKDVEDKLINMQIGTDTINYFKSKYAEIFKLTTQDNDGYIITCRTSDDSVYYITNDKNFYKYDICGTHTSSNLSQILIDGTTLQNNATCYLSDKLTDFIYISDNCYIVFDEADNNIKLVGNIPE